MSTTVLFLDHQFRPLRVEAWQRAITDLFLGKDRGGRVQPRPDDPRRHPGSPDAVGRAGPAGLQARQAAREVLAVEHLRPRQLHLCVLRPSGA